MKRSLVLLLAFLTLAISLGGCKYLPAPTIDNPKEGTPEWLVYKAIEAAQEPDAEKSYKMIRPYLHSNLISMRTAEESFLGMNYPAFRRKVRLFTPDDKSPVYKLSRTEEDQPDQNHRLFVVNEGSDMPSPFRIARDPAANNEWRIMNVP